MRAGFFLLLIASLLNVSAMAENIPPPPPPEGKGCLGGTDNEWCIEAWGRDDARALLRQGRFALVDAMTKSRRERIVRRVYGKFGIELIDLRLPSKATRSETLGYQLGFNTLMGDAIEARYGHRIFNELEQRVDQAIRTSRGQTRHDKHKRGQ